MIIKLHPFIVHKRSLVRIPICQVIASWYSGSLQKIWIKKSISTLTPGTVEKNVNLFFEEYIVAKILYTWLNVSKQYDSSVIAFLL